MKKITAAILVVAFLFSFWTLAYAETADTSGDTSTVWQQKRDALQLRVQSAKDLVAHLQPQITEIKNNRAEIADLKAEARKAYADAVAHLKELKKNPDDLTDEQTAELKQAVETLKQSRAALSDTMGDIRTEIQEMRVARKEQDTEQVEESLNSIITIQENRIQLIKTSIANINKILEI